MGKIKLEEVKKMNKMRTSPKGKKYIGKAVFQTKELAKSRANNLKSRGYTAWVEGRTVYNK